MLTFWAIVNFFCQNTNVCVMTPSELLAWKPTNSNRDSTKNEIESTAWLREMLALRLNVLLNIKYTQKRQSYLAFLQFSQTRCYSHAHLHHSKAQPQPKRSSKLVEKLSDGERRIDRCRNHNILVKCNIKRSKIILSSCLLRNYSSMNLNIEENCLKI